MDEIRNKQQEREKIVAPGERYLHAHHNEKVNELWENQQGSLNGREHNKRSLAWENQQKAVYGRVIDEPAGPEKNHEGMILLVLLAAGILLIAAVIMTVLPAIRKYQEKLSNMPSIKAIHELQEREDGDPTEGKTDKADGESADAGIREENTASGAENDTDEAGSSSTADTDETVDIGVVSEAVNRSLHPVADQDEAFAELFTDLKEADQVGLLTDSTDSIYDAFIKVGYDREKVYREQTEEDDVVMVNTVDTYIFVMDSEDGRFISISGGERLLPKGLPADAGKAAVRLFMEEHYGLEVSYSEKDMLAYKSGEDYIDFYFIQDKLSDQYIRIVNK